MFYNNYIHVSLIYGLNLRACAHACVRFPSEHSPRVASSARGAPAAPSGRFPCDSTSERHILRKRKKKHNKIGSNSHS